MPEKTKKTILKRMDKYNRAEHETFTTYVVPVLLAILIKNKVYSKEYPLFLCLQDGMAPL